MTATRLRRSRAVHVAAASVTALALAVGTPACGDDDESADETTTTDVAFESAEEVTLTAVEYGFDLSATPTADTKSVTFQNDGEEVHVMIFARINEGHTLDEAIELNGEQGSATTVAELEVAPGKSDTAEIKKPIEPGSYAMLCPIGGPKGPHYALGQLQEFDIS